MPASPFQTLDMSLYGALFPFFGLPADGKVQDQTRITFFFFFYSFIAEKRYFINLLKENKTQNFFISHFTFLFLSVSSSRKGLNGLLRDNSCDSREDSQTGLFLPESKSFSPNCRTLWRQSRPITAMEFI